MPGRKCCFLGADVKEQDLTGIFLFLPFALLFSSCTIVKNEQVSSGSITAEEESFKGFSYRDSNFNPQEYADAIWEPVVLPRIESLAVDIHVLLSGLESDENGASQKYGYRHLQEGNLFNFSVKGTAKILSVDTRSMNGFVSVDLEPFDGKADFQRNIGPIFRGNTIRDIQDTISINDFLNQTEFARLARELNNKVRDLVLSDIDFSQHIGETAEFLGVFTYNGRGSLIEITPVRLTFTENS
jgi:predicted lipoprotein